MFPNLTCLTLPLWRFLSYRDQYLFCILGWPTLGHNILELYYVLVQICLTTSKMKRDIKYSKLGIEVASQVAKPLKT